MTSLICNSPLAQEELENAASRIGPPLCAKRLWDRYLTTQDQAKLGGDWQQSYRQLGTAGMWVKLHGVTEQKAVVAVAKLLGFLREEDYNWLLRESEEPVDVDEAIDSAISLGDLVLKERPREAYWDSQLILIDWYINNKAWEFLWTLSRSAKSGQPIDRDSFGETAHRNVVTDRKSKLSKTPGFPIDLIDVIEVVGLGTQQLMLPRERIRLFELSERNMLVECLP